MLTPEQLEQRKGKLTASRVSCLMMGDPNEIYSLWQELTGDPDFVPKDLSWIWPIMLGQATENVNLAWYSHKTGRPLSRQGEVVICPSFDWAACTLDAFDEAIPACVEAKCVGGWEDRSVIIKRYYPQCHWQMLCTETKICMLSIIEGGGVPVIEEIYWDEQYGAILLERAKAFMECVKDLRPPVSLPKIVPIIPDKNFDMRDSNSWAEYANMWLTNREGAKLFSDAINEIKSLIPEDAIRCYGHGIEAKRAKNGRISIREEEDGSEHS